MGWTPPPDNGIDVPEWKCHRPLEREGASIPLLTFHHSYRIENYDRTGAPSGTPYWHLYGDNKANGSAPVLPAYWDLYDITHAVPSDPWPSWKCSGIAERRAIPTGASGSR